jgi:hypothetical protein
MRVEVGRPPDKAHTRRRIRRTVSELQVVNDVNRAPTDPAGEEACAGAT